MGRVPQGFIDELIARADIVEIIGTRVQLKKQGREYKACCPFHNEKTPSFWVSPEKQFYHCFGCGAHGTTLGFLMEYDKLSFPEAIEDLAQRLGLEVPREGGDAQGSAPKRIDDSSYEMMGRVARFYSETLARDSRAREYVAKRGLTKETVDRFAIGYAPNSWNEVLRRFGGNDAARRQLFDLGLIIERDAGQVRDGERYYDRFRDRVMFPIRDARGRVMAFGGRVIDQGEPKYLNSPETALFHKGRELYGLYEVRQSRTSLTRLMIVEGYMDVVRLHQYGVVYSAATLGTATTPEHLKRIFRLVSEVVFAFDGDRAGRSAAWRALQNSLPEVREGREIRFLFLPEGHDPDSLVGEEGREAFEKRLATALPLSEYLVRELTEQVDLSHADGRARFAAAARPLLAKIPVGVYHDLLLDRLAETIRLSPQRLAELWSTDAKPQETPAREVQTRHASRTPVGAGRGSLVRQAITRLLWFPAIATEVGADERAALDAVEEPGIELLRELLDNLRAHPAQIPAQVIERWADKPGQDAFKKLLEREEVITDAPGAARELRATLVKLGDLPQARRQELLLSKTDLTSEERLELQRLTQRRAAGPRPR